MTDESFSPSNGRPAGGIDAAILLAHTLAVSYGWHAGDVLRKLREAKGLRIEDLAAKAGVSKNTVSTFENQSREAMTGTLPKLSAALGVSASYVLAHVPKWAPADWPEPAVKESHQESANSQTKPAAIKRSQEKTTNTGSSERLRDPGRHTSVKRLRQHPQLGSEAHDEPPTLDLVAIEKSGSDLLARLEEQARELLDTIKYVRSLKDHHERLRVIEDDRAKKSGVHKSGGKGG